MPQHERSPPHSGPAQDPCEPSPFFTASRCGRPGPIELLEGMQGHVEPTLKMNRRFEGIALWCHLRRASCVMLRVRLTS